MKQNNFSKHTDISRFAQIETALYSQKKNANDGTIRFLILNVLEAKRCDWFTRSATKNLVTFYVQEHHAQVHFIISQHLV